MTKILGLDIGTNSIGWALVAENERIIDVGVRIFPVGVQEDKFSKSNTEESKNQARRLARTIRRGYDRYKQRRARLRKILRELGMHPSEQFVLSARALYALRKKGLEEQLSLQEIGRVFLHLNQRRGFLSSRKDLQGDQKETSEIKLQMLELEQKVVESGARTLGEYFFGLFPKEQETANLDAPIERIRARFVSRKLYESEFELIWAKQSTYYPELLTGNNKKRIKDECILYQRPLKSAKHLVGKCRLEPGKRCAPLSSPAFQEFRIWETLHRIRVTNGERVSDALTKDELLKGFEALNQTEKLSLSALKKALGLPKDCSFNDIPDPIKGNITKSRIVNAVGKEFIELYPHMLEKLWHTLLFASDFEWVTSYAIDKWGFTPEQAKSFAGTALEDGYANLSNKAIQKMLPFLRVGANYPDAAAAAGYHHSFDEEHDGKERILQEKAVLGKEDNLRSPLVQAAVNETTRLVNAIIDEYGKPDKIRVEFFREMKKPKEVREDIRRKQKEVEDRRARYEAFLKKEFDLVRVRYEDLIKFELFLELEHSETELKKIAPNVDAEAFRAFRRKVNFKDQEKYKLWLECGRISPYSGKVIPLNKLLSGEIQVQHILPYSRSFDDSFANKTLIEAELNVQVGNQLAWEYFRHQPEDRWRSFKQRIKVFSEGKREKLLMETLPEDFINRQATLTAYIGKATRNILKRVCRDVEVTSGTATAILRRTWGLDRILAPEKGTKTRDDHRHHAVDALVVACTTPGHIQRLAKESQILPDGRPKPPSNFGLPFPGFNGQAHDLIPNILVSYKNQRKLISWKKNKYIHSKSPTKTFQRVASVRGPLHEESNYGRIRLPGKDEHSYVIRKPVSSITDSKQLSKIVDEGTQRAIQRFADKYHAGDLKKAVSDPENPPYFESKKGHKIPIKAVRVKDSAKSMIMLRPNENPKLFVSPGSNFLIAIYEDPVSRKRAFESVSFFDAVQKKRCGEYLYPPTKDGKPLLFTLRQREMVVVYDQHPDEIQWNNPSWLNDHLFMVRKFDVNGLFGLTKHSLANLGDDGYKLPKGYTPRVNTLRALKVKITRTGKVVRLFV